MVCSFISKTQPNTTCSGQLGFFVRDTMNYIKLMRDGFTAEKQWRDLESRLEYLSDEIFNFTTYDSEMAELLASKAIEVCKAITENKTFEYITDKENYKWYLLMCNMPFFAERIELGTSVRGAWWNASTFLFDGDEIKFSVEEWAKFINAIVEFADDSELSPKGECHE